MGVASCQWQRHSLDCRVLLIRGVNVDTNIGGGAVCFEVGSE